MSKIKFAYQVTGWNRALNAARFTAGKKSSTREPSDQFKRKMLLAEHSPIRLIEWDIAWEQIQQWVTTHLVRHHEGCEKFVHSQRIDRNSDIAGAFTSRDDVPQGQRNEMMMTLNAQAIINISRKRLCSCASKETREAWVQVLTEIQKADPILVEKCVPECVYRGFCPEVDKCCGFVHTQKFLEALADYRQGGIEH